MAQAQTDGSEGTPPSVATSASDAHQASEPASTASALYDRLTGLPNRALMEERLAQAAQIYRQQGYMAVFAVIGLDGFRAINDRYGTAAGDFVLQEMARRMSKCLRAGDSLGRLGGDTFGLLMCGLEDESPCEAEFKHWLAAVSEPMTLPGGESISLTATIGASMFPDHGVDGVIAQAEDALRDAKESSRGSFQYAPPPNPLRLLKRLGYA
jgi:diguanylate cyclase (GGDEF)-like protein